MKYFGTDGIRDRVTGPLMQQSFVYRLGRAVGLWLNRSPASASRHVAIGRDTRASAGYLFLSLARGLHDEGVKIFDAGVCPTPAVASAIRILGLDLGVVITASHNPATDNGIKLFGPGGCKLREQQETEIETILDEMTGGQEDHARTPPVRYFEARRHYLEAYEKLLPENSLMGLRIVLDCANGATYRTSGDLLSRFGAQVFSYGCHPDGDNINAGYGSEHTDVVSRAVLEHAADVGISHDGDGDRVILCDHRGKVVDGDAILAILATAWARRARLPHKTVVSTIMSNLGLDKCLEEAGVSLKRVGVGDRQVFYAMQAEGYSLGGESSGHFIAMDYLPTGDGLLAALLVLHEVVMHEQPLEELASVFQPFPQLKKNLTVRKKPPLEELPELQSELKGMEENLGKRGRILVRYSGTEPMVRLLAEAENPELAESTMEVLEEVVGRYLPTDRRTGS